MGCGSCAPRAGGCIEEPPRGSGWRDVLDHWKWIGMDDGGYKGCRAGTSTLAPHPCLLIRSYSRHITCHATALLSPPIDVQTHFPTAHLRPRPSHRGFPLPPLLLPLPFLPHPGTARVLLRTRLEAEHRTKMVEGDGIPPAYYVGVYEGCGY